MSHIIAHVGVCPTSSHTCAGCGAMWSNVGRCGCVWDNAYIVAQGAMALYMEGGASCLTVAIALRQNASLGIAKVSSPASEPRKD